MLAHESGGGELTSIQRATNMPGTGTIIISSPDSQLLIWAWYDAGTIYYYTLASRIYLNPNSSYMFAGLSNLRSIDMR